MQVGGVVWAYIMPPFWHLTADMAHAIGLEF